MAAADDGHEHGIDWFRGLDMIVWVAVIIILTMGVEWLLGRYIRERMASGAQKYLAKVTSETPGT